MSPRTLPHARELNIKMGECHIAALSGRNGAWLRVSFRIQHTHESAPDRPFCFRLTPRLVLARVTPPGVFSTLHQRYKPARPGPLATNTRERRSTDSCNQRTKITFASWNTIFSLRQDRSIGSFTISVRCSPTKPRHSSTSFRICRKSDDMRMDTAIGTCPNRDANRGSARACVARAACADSKQWKGGDRVSVVAQLRHMAIPRAGQA